ncbi:MAG: SpoIIE family protein phosphatase [Brevinematales bacterium]|nr:SpoIIE family protein phosphatase [Brevinematales bacterium]
MSESLVGYTTFIILQIMIWYLIIKTPAILKFINTRLILLIVLFSSFITLFVSVSWDTAKLELFDITNISLRVTFTFMVLDNLAIFRLILTFPKERNLPIIDILLVIVAIIAIYFTFFTNLIFIGATLKEGVLFRIEGKYYSLSSVLASSLLMASSIIGIIRAFKMKERIHKLQMIMIVIGTSLSLLIAVLIAMIIPLVFKTFKFYYLSPLTSFVLAGTLIYAITRTKLFNISSGIYNTAAIITLTVIVGTIGGTLFNTLSKQNIISSNMTPIIELILFSSILLVSRYIDTLIRKILKFKSHYLETLRKDLSSLELNKSEHEIVNHLVKSLKENISSSKINIFIENEVGILENIFSENNILKNLEKGDKAFDILSSYKNKNIFFLSEVISDPFLKQHEDLILNFFKDLNAEVIILAKDGEHIIMVISLGEKENGTPYDNYDYQTLNEIYINLFTIGYILKNQRKQKTTTTVKREIEMSKFIIENLVSNINKPNRNILDLEFLTKSSSGLGGDFVDIIALSKDKYLIVVGDISGKGLTASMSMVVIKSSIQTLIRRKINFKSLVSELNKIIKENLPKGTFFSGVFMIVDISQKSMFFINNGIPVIWYYSSKNRTVAQIQGEGKVLGFVKDISKLIEVKKVSLEKGDIIAVATDGFTEATSIDGTQFDLSAVEKIIKQNSEKYSSEILTKIFDTWYEFSNRQIKDDISLLIFRMP